MQITKIHYKLYLKHTAMRSGGIDGTVKRRQYRQSYSSGCGSRQGARVYDQRSLAGTLLSVRNLETLGAGEENPFSGTHFGMVGGVGWVEGRGVVGRVRPWFALSAEKGK